MKLLFKIFVCLVVFGAIGYGIFSINKQSAHAISQTYTCQADGSYAQPTSGPAALTSSDTTKISASAAWLESMTHTTTKTVTNSTVTPNADYPSSYQGSIDGTFNLQGRSFPTDAALSITSPMPIADTYRGVVTGHVLAAPEQWRWIIQAYKRVNGVISQVPVQALADGTTGDFSIDLSSVGAGTAGEWMFGILDANNSYAPYGPTWPDANYVGLEVRQYVVTDSVYYWSTTPAKDDGTFSFPNSNTGEKMYRLVDTTTNPNDILAEYSKPTGLLRSYLYQPGETGYGTAMENRSFVYDQAVALEAAISLRDNSLAKLLTDGLLRLQTTSGSHTGGFVFAAPQLSPSYTDPMYRTGAHAIATDALLSYIQTYPSDPDIATYKTAATKALEFLNSTISSSGGTAGLYLGGFGDYSGNPQVFDPSVTITWASTEHNIDTWHTLLRASNVLGNSTVNYKQQADTLETPIMNTLYDSAHHRFNQGYNDSGADTADPLDVNSWGAIQLYATGHLQEASDALARVPLFSHTTGSGVSGYGPFYDSGGYPGATPTVWYEGSFGVALAYYRTGDYTAYRSLIDSLANGQEADGSFRYATDPDSTYEIGNSKSVASTAWYILATTGRNTIWNTCLYMPPPSTDTSTPPATAQPTKVTTKPTTPYTQSAATTTPDTVATAPAETSSPTAPTTNQPSKTGVKNSSSTTNNQNQMPAILTATGGVIVVAGVATWIGLAVRRSHKL